MSLAKEKNEFPGTLNSYIMSIKSVKATEEPVMDSIRSKKKREEQEV